MLTLPKVAVQALGSAVRPYGCVQLLLLDSSSEFGMGQKCLKLLDISLIWSSSGGKKTTNQQKKLQKPISFRCWMVEGLSLAY